MTESARLSWGTRRRTVMLSGERVVERLGPTVEDVQVEKFLDTQQLEIKYLAINHPAGKICWPRTGEWPWEQQRR
jgi:hypothetical protein